MSITPARIIFQPPKKKMIGSIEIQMFESESYTRNSSMTSFPIEDGSTISEHIINQPKEVSVNGFIGVNALGIGSTWITVFDQINDLIDSKSLISIVMGLKIYDNMHIESFDVTRDKATGQGLPFTMKLKEAVIIQSQVTNIPSAKISGTVGNKTQLEGDQNLGDANNGQTQTKNQVSKAYQDGLKLGKGVFQ